MSKVLLKPPPPAGNDEAQQTSTAFMFSANTAFMKAGVQGLSILFASGDQGVCGREGCGLLKKVFHPDFPAASPYITAVGGTDFLGSGVGDEKAWQAGGGGFSNTFDIPAYQSEAVAAYKARPDANLCSFFFNLGSHVVDFGYYFSHCYLCC